MSLIELGVLLDAARRFAANKGLELASRKFSDAMASEFTAAFHEACRLADEDSGSQAGDALSTLIGGRRDVRDLAEVMVQAVLVDEVTALARTLTASDHPHIDVDFFDVDPVEWFGILIRHVEGSVRHRSQGDKNPLANWYHSVAMRTAALVASRTVKAVEDRLSMQTTRQPAIESPGETSGTSPTRLPIFRLPEPLNSLAVGQEAAVAAIAEGLAQRPRRVLHGLGGVGKTQLAIRFAHDHRSEYDVVWGTRAGSPAQLAASHAELGRALGVVGPDTPVPEAVAAVREWLAGHDRWLLIFDAAREPAELRDLVPDAITGGQVVVTSTNPNWRAFGEPQAVVEPSVDDAAAYLWRRAGRPADGDAHALAADLGCLPLALDQAAAYCEASATSFASYRRLYAEMSARLLARGPVPDDHPDSVPATIALAVAGAASEHPAVIDMLVLCAVLARRPMHHGLLRTAAPQLPSPLGPTLTEDAEFDDLVAALRRFSLAERLAEHLVLHRLTQDATEVAQGSVTTERWLRIAVEAFKNILPVEAADPSAWATYEELFDHVHHVCDGLTDLGAPTFSVAWLLDRLGTYLEARGSFTEAIGLFSTAHRVGAATAGENAGSTLSFLNNLGAAYRQVEPSQAREILLEVVERYENLDHMEGRDEGAYAVALQNLGHAEIDLGLPDAANQLMAALALYGRMYPEAEWHRHTQIAHLINNIGLLERQRGEWAAALRSFARAAKLHTKRFGADHPEVARSLRNMAVVQTEVGELDTALTTMDTALAIEERTLGPDHVQVARTLRERANTRRVAAGPGGQALVDAALLDDLRAADIIDARFSPPHPEVAACHNSLGIDLLTRGDIARRLGNDDDADVCYQRAESEFAESLRMRREFFGRRHPAVVQSLTNVGRVQLRRTDPDAAEASFREALTIVHELGSDGSANHGLALDGLGEVAEARQQWDDALARYSSAHEILVRVHGPDAPTSRREADKVDRVRKRV